MIQPIIIALIISIMSALLAAILVFTKKVLLNYGDIELDINNGEKKITMPGGSSLLETLIEQKLFIPSACGGRGTCGYCRVKVLEGGGPFLPTEESFINKEEQSEGFRLSCQVKLRQDIKIEIPPELLSIREYMCRCDGIRDYTYDIREFTLRLIQPEQIKYKPGQYVQVLAPQYQGNSEEVYRAYSISSDPADNTKIELIIRRVAHGICTTYLFDHFKKGDQLKINGPYGEFFLRDTMAPIIFIAGGSGIAPIKAMLHHMQNQKIERKAIFFFGVNTLNDLFLVQEMKRFEKNIPDFEFVPVISKPEPSDNWSGKTGFVTVAVEQYLKTTASIKDHEAYLCGSPGLIEATINILKKYGIPDQKHYYDKFA
jgi:Na+-transporting NADH:ubiquinone oxidoreductase subunit F